ncbi:hypothetical protein [Curtobacterium sp. MCBA15_001]|uniref:hypothetical protein n=1 Tax=Curtobacterium sp. MCBA15_001 TaxID=1898731 RepID=UPI0008DE9C22|nr:hypothetical protein [Curtobacterium sp. MCBA15_001]OIH95408.1 hypothetical protein BIU90_01500 [Curtobacterium sp. MCBA15_001]
MDDGAAPVASASHHRRRSDSSWLDAYGVPPLDDRDGRFWADESREYGPYAVTGERLADFDPHPSEDLREVAWTRSDGGEHIGAVEWGRALGYVQNEPVDVLASKGEQLWATVSETSPLAAWGSRIVDAPFTDLYRGRTAF